MLQWWVHRKDFMPALASAMLAKMQDPNSVDWGELLWAVKRALEEKHLIAYFGDPAWQSVVDDNGWGGVVSSPPGDYLMIVDSNVGYNKVNPNIQQSISYEVQIAPGGSARGTVTLDYRSRITRVLTECLHVPKYEVTYDLMMEDCYWDYLRVYVPPGSELVSTSGEAEFNPPAQELGKAMFSAFIVLAPGETKRIAFEYELPPDALVQDSQDVRYHLTAQKQPGTRSTPLQIKLSFPDDLTVTAVTPPPSEQTASYLAYDVNLRTDLTFELRLGID